VDHLRWKIAHNLIPGDVLFASWGYEDSNVDFYQILRTLGEPQVEIQALAQKTVRQTKNGFFIRPMIGRFARNSKPMRKRVTPDGTVKIDSNVYARKWDRRPKFQTSKLYGH